MSEDKRKNRMFGFVTETWSPLVGCITVFTVGLGVKLRGKRRTVRNADGLHHTFIRKG